ncbi:MAG TPA: hypothetical protein VE860_02225 [Chthoniobacterales bacterium]|nr:hypothetical protein [Chthoniobacterales bacterium]
MRKNLWTEVEFPSSQETEIIVSTKAVTEIQRLVREEGEVKLSIGENQIAFELNRTLLVSKLSEGKRIPGLCHARI